DAENKRQPGRHQEKHDPELDAVEPLLDQQRRAHADPPIAATPRPFPRVSARIVSDRPRRDKPDRRAARWWRRVALPCQTAAPQSDVARSRDALADAAAHSRRWRDGEEGKWDMFSPSSRRAPWAAPSRDACTSAARRCAPRWPAAVRQAHGVPPNAA